MKARIPKHREFIINFPDSIDQNKALPHITMTRRSWP